MTTENKSIKRKSVLSHATRAIVSDDVLEKFKRRAAELGLIIYAKPEQAPKQTNKKSRKK